MIAFFILCERKNKNEHLNILRTYNSLVCLSDDVRETVTGIRA